MSPLKRLPKRSGNKGQKRLKSLKILYIVDAKKDDTSRLFLIMKNEEKQKKTIAFGWEIVYYCECKWWKVVLSGRKVVGKCLKGSTVIQSMPRDD